jgi:hypothetical protein
MCSRSFSSTVHQYLLAFWQTLPLCVSLIQMIFSVDTSGSLLSRHQTKVYARASPKTPVPHSLLWLGPKSSFLQYQPPAKPNDRNCYSACPRIHHELSLLLRGILTLDHYLRTTHRKIRLQLVHSFGDLRPQHHEDFHAGQSVLTSLDKSYASRGTSILTV